MSSIKYLEDDDQIIEGKRKPRSKKLQTALNCLFDLKDSSYSLITKKKRRSNKTALESSSHMRIRRANSADSIKSGSSRVTMRSIGKTKMRTSTVAHTTTLKSARSVDGAQMINQYQLGETIGRGSYGHVKLCSDLNTDKTYAVKIIHRK